MLTIECLKVEKERLRVLNQYVITFIPPFLIFFFSAVSVFFIVGARYRRMIGKELDGMGYSELLVFSCAIQGGMLKAEEEKKKIKRARQVLGGI